MAAAEQPCMAPPSRASSMLLTAKAGTKRADPGPLTWEQWVLRRKLAALWVFLIVLTHAVYISVAAFVLDKPPLSIGLYFPERSEGGVTMRELGGLLALAAVIGAAMTAAQELVRPLMSEKQRGEKIFFFSSVAMRFVFLGVLAYHHYGPGGWDAAIESDGRHRMLLMSLFFAAYSTDVLQLWRRPHEFPKSFRSFMVAHHVLSFAWFTPWLIAIAPRVVQGEAIWKTVFVYLTAAVPNHTYKLIGCWYKPHWYQHLVVPAILGHWAVLIASQGYFWHECMCSSWGCWYPASMIMLFGAWGMAFYDVPSFFDVLVVYHTKLYGCQFGIWDILPILFKNKGCPIPAAAAAAAAAAAGAAPGSPAVGSLSRAGSAGTIEVELLLPAAAAALGAKGASELRARRPGAPAVA
ncbi:MAG: hypothetical protein J3K34DRAFT_223931 [Monoraphidium minutum]|nr:MAG: hypothetical protein J3K34DRAFT_223931 [Monoraphidium minutum]